MKIKFEKVGKRFGRLEAVKDVSFEFETGNVVGLIGPNGAGKTTAMLCLATLDEPTSGDIFLDELSVVQFPEEARRKIGFMPDFLPDEGDMTVFEYIDFYARAFGLRGEELRKRVEEVEAFTNLTNVLDRRISKLSKGMKQRVSLARTLVHDPEVLVLDEPAAGLDPRARVELRDLVNELKGRGKAILISSHILSELEEMCTNYLIIKDGEIVARLGACEDIESEYLKCVGSEV